LTCNPAPPLMIPMALFSVTYELSIVTVDCAATATSPPESDKLRLKSFPEMVAVAPMMLIAPPYAFATLCSKRQWFIVTFDRAVTATALPENAKDLDKLKMDMLTDDAVRGFLANYLSLAALSPRNLLISVRVLKHSFILEIENCYG